MRSAVGGRSIAQHIWRRETWWAFYRKSNLEREGTCRVMKGVLRRELVNVCAVSDAPEKVEASRSD